ncbi:hypothetical protein JCM31447_12030 [Fluviispira sanaruensis]|uniref:Uncharacterized protein n=1 Tax=Fluviispira sanaruensis TaxID=2493639 RepID=A0A4P2VLS3_FLUSA|nr:hypothetical protein JCM31447_12030 [Fluviispira sanaruensis]
MQSEKIHKILFAFNGKKKLSYLREHSEDLHIRKHFFNKGIMYYSELSLRSTILHVTKLINNDIKNILVILTIKKNNCFTSN